MIDSWRYHVGWLRRPRTVPGLAVCWRPQHEHVGHSFQVKRFSRTLDGLGGKIRAPRRVLNGVEEVLYSGARVPARLSTQETEVLAALAPGASALRGGQGCVERTLRAFMRPLARYKQHPLR